MEQLSNILNYAQDCDVHTLEDLYTWLKNVAIHKSNIPGLKSSALKAAALVKKLIILKLNSQLKYACGGNIRRMQ